MWFSFSVGARTISAGRSGCSEERTQLAVRGQVAKRLVAAGLEAREVSGKRPHADLLLEQAVRKEAHDAIEPELRSDTRDQVGLARPAFERARGDLVDARELECHARLPAVRHLD